MKSWFGAGYALHDCFLPIVIGWLVVYSVRNITTLPQKHHGFFCDSPLRCKRVVGLCTNGNSSCPLGSQFEASWLYRVTKVFRDTYFVDLKIRVASSEKSLHLPRLMEQRSLKCQQNVCPRPLLSPCRLGSRIAVSATAPVPSNYPWLDTSNCSIHSPEKMNFNEGGMFIWRQKIFRIFLTGVTSHTLIFFGNKAISAIEAV